MNREENITNIDWDNQVFETEDGSVLPFAVDEEINVLTENLNSADGVIYVYNPQNDNEEK
jgi:uncharacterized protein YfaS (alpha-2-macroglobulin family)